MKLKIEKIDSLINKGFVLKTQLGTLIPNLISPQGKSINTFSRRYGDDPLAGFSWIAFFFPFAVAAQIRHWNYFWLIGIFGFIVDVLSLITKLDIISYAGLGIAILYGYWFPYQRWFFNKSNKNELGKIESIFVGIGLTIVASIPSLILLAFS